ncbi:MAG: hypothetical protein AAF356_11350 [Planctomycetota bacterium]
MVDRDLVRHAIEAFGSRERLELERLWAYFRNERGPVPPGIAGVVRQDRPGRLAQEAGLPARVVGRSGESDDRWRGRREVVIENDIAWRVQTMVDFLMGEPVRLVSESRDAELGAEIERVLEAVWEASGGIAMLQDAALLGHVYGHVDLVVRVDEEALLAWPGGGGGDAAGDIAAGAAGAIRIEPVEPVRGVPVVSEADYRVLDAYAVHAERELNELEGAGGHGGVGGRSRSGRAFRLFGREEREASTGRVGGVRRRRGTVTEVLTPSGWWVERDGEVIERGERSLLRGVVPVVHVQNLSQPFRWGGLGEVEPLVALQDELNTRLSDRASRVTLQSFKMYLARRLDGFDPRLVGPGVVWQSDDPESSIESFGGDASSPSEERHIEEVREALDKVSAVPPLAGGVIRARVGNLSSATALRVTLMGLLAKTRRKRVTYGGGIARASALVLAALDEAGVLRTGAADRRVRVVWPDPVPGDERSELAVAGDKVNLGVPRERVLAELGYASGSGAAEPGIS